MRADLLMVQQGLVKTRTKAQSLILAGVVLTKNGKRIEKSSDFVDSNTILRLKNNPIPYVSRGGIKLAAMLKENNLDVKNKICMDIGASTGGFTDCLLQNGASRVYAIDVGYGQLDWKLRKDNRVIVMERTNMRYLKTDSISEKIDCIVIDVSFISLKLIIPVAVQFSTLNTLFVCLVKPQFEVQRHNVGKGGIVRDPKLHKHVLDTIKKHLQEYHIFHIKMMESPIKGAKGNHEFLLSGIYNYKKCNL